MKQEKLPTPLRGIVPPMVTPLLSNDALDVNGLEKLIEHILGGGVHGLFILGTTGEAPNLSYHLRHELVKRTCEQVAGRVPVLVGITDTVVSESLRLANTAAEAGAAAVVSAPPYYFTPSQDELVHYYKHLADRLPLPLFLYNMPSHTKVSFAPATVKAIAKHPNVVGLKDSSGNTVYFQLMCNALKDNPDFSLLIGPEEVTAEAVLMGGHGGVNGGANLFPQLYVDLYEAALTKDFELIGTLQNHVLEISSHLYTVSSCGTSYLKGVKAALSVLGICSDFMAEPHQSYQAEEKLKIRGYLKEIKSNMQGQYQSTVNL
ncbi:dihydrodipicolinate synthase family protein [Rufibacter tibetensis]|uniref:Dihydrodipicolinate synthase n=1 Tax=Rufibacter tibetensis TaxID=512763 RepID=A0A0N7HXC2_9BACT|nr:dihydrodipicolinate synthase family protein [Rufibacter tibetensis]ALJ01641.1 dihydrodipicolinate synthase [Rufibacter tibetensis]